jgi:hypothetical protein
VKEAIYTGPYPLSFVCEPKGRGAEEEEDAADSDIL